MQIRYYGDKISNRIAKTPEGFLICQDVPISRTGYQEYLASEIMENPVNGHKIIPVFRPATEVFDIRSLASFEGKPVTNEHPDEDVTPDNYTRYACGHVQNVHPGEGEDSNKVLADLYITDPSLINSILSGKREISCGYYAEEKRDASGKLCQTKIRGNHVAVVNSGRAGSKVRIRDKRAVYDYSEDELFEDACGYEDEDEILGDDEVYVEDLTDEDEDLIQDYGVKGMKHTGGFQKGNQYRFKSGNPYRFRKRGDDGEEMLDDDDAIYTDEDDMIRDYSEEELFEDEDLDAIEDDDELDVIEDDDEEFIGDDDEELIQDYGVKGMKKGQHVMEGKHVKEQPKKGLSTRQKVGLGMMGGGAALMAAGLGMKGAARRMAKRAAGAQRALPSAGNAIHAEVVRNVPSRMKLANPKRRLALGHDADYDESDLFEDCGMYDDDELIDACGGRGDEDIFEDDDFESMEDDGEELLAEDDDEELMADDDFEEVEDDDEDMINDYSEEELFEDDDEIMAEDDDEEFIGDDDDFDAIEDDDDEIINDYSEEELFEDDDDEPLEDDDLEEPIGDDDEEIDAIVSDDDEEFIGDDDDEEFIGDDDDFDPSVEDDDELDAIEDDELEEDDDEEVIEDDDDVDVMPTDEVEQKMAQGSTLDTRKDAALREIVNATRGITNAQERKSVQDAIYKAFCSKSQMGDIMRTIERNARSKRDSMAQVQTQMSAKGQQAIYDSFNPHKQSGK